MVFLQTFLRALNQKKNNTDVHQCAQLWEQVSAHYPFAIGGRWTPEGVQAELQRSAAVGIFLQSKLVGFCLYRQMGVRLAQTVEIMLVAVTPDMQGKGFAKQLINALISKLEPHDVIWLEVHYLNQPAVRLYESLGFLKVGARSNYYSDGGEALLFEYRQGSVLSS